MLMLELQTVSFEWLSAAAALDEARAAFTSWGPAVQPPPTPAQGAASAWPLPSP